MLAQIGTHPSLLASDIWLLRLGGTFGCCIANEGLSLLPAQIGTHPSMLASVFGYLAWLLLLAVTLRMKGLPFRLCGLVPVL